MSAKKRAPFGTWPSPITPALAARASRRLGMLQAAGDAICWTEARPEQGGRQTIMRITDEGKAEELLMQPFSARSRIHEYGGGELLAVGDTIYFCNDRDQQVHMLTPGHGPRRLTSVFNTRFADFAHDANRRRLLAVAEQHGAAPKPRNMLVAVALSGRRGKVSELAAGRGFYASPRLSPDGRSLAFLAWDLPDMPWDSATLYVADARDDGTIGRPKRIAGGNGSFVFQPEWGPDGCLYFVWDKTGWGGLYRWQGDRVARVQARRGADLSRAQWVLGMRSFALHPDGRFAAIFLQQGRPRIDTGSLAAGRAVQAAHCVQAHAARIDQPIAFADGFAALVATPTSAPVVARITGSGIEVLGPRDGGNIEREFVSRGEVRTFRRPDGEAVHGIYYAPTNPHYEGPNGASPPALVLVHGGPTSMADTGLKMSSQFYTSRGFAVFDVNYSGSTGYGRAYRCRLDGQWGIADVADCAAAARHLARQGLADASRIAIAGGSAGGYTVLMALATTDAFAAGSSHYGVSDLRLLLKHTHKFESGYLHRLLGTKPGKWRDVFAARSPLNLTHRIKAPLILFQGLDDKIVPPEQSRLIVEKLEKRGIEVTYHEFAGEGHGFRSAQTIIAVLEAELAFLRHALRLG